MLPVEVDESRGKQTMQDNHILSTLLFFPQSTYVSSTVLERAPKHFTIISLESHIGCYSRRFKIQHGYASLPPYYVQIFM